MTKKIFTLFFSLILSLSVFSESGIYVGGHFRRERTVAVPTLKASGFTYVILFNVQVEPNGDLTTDGEMICSNGVYVFGSKQPNYQADVAALKTGTTSITRIETCVGGWTSPSYKNIKALITAQGYGPTSILYKNFQAFKKALPDIEAINNDEEDTYDVTTTTNFHVMLYDLGFKTTLAPYTNKPFWQSVATNINNLRPGAVDRIYIQCYDGGASNNPKDWNINNITLHSGVWNFDPATTVKTKMTDWKNTSNTVGGFMWVYNDNSYSLKTYAAAINSAFYTIPHLTVYPDCNYLGTSATFEAGVYNVNAIAKKSFADKSLSSFQLAPGFKVMLYKKDNYSGTAVTIENSTACLEDLNLNDSIKSWVVRPNGDNTLSAKIFYLKNRKSNMYMSVANASLITNAGIVQKSFTGTNDQKWKFTAESYGVYRLVNVNSNKVMQVRNASLLDGAVLEQYSDASATNQKFIFQKTGFDDFYKIIPYQSTKFLKIDAAQSNVNNASVMQGGIVSDIETDWELIPENVTSLSETLNVDENFSIYPNPVTDYLTIENSKYTIEKIEISDLQGRNVLVQNNGDNRINLSGVNAGMYFITINAAGIASPFVTKFAKK